MSSIIRESRMPYSTWNESMLETGLATMLLGITRSSRSFPDQYPTPTLPNPSRKLFCVKIRCISALETSALFGILVYRVGAYLTS